MQPQRKERAGEEEEVSSPRPSFFASSRHRFSGTEPHCWDGRNGPDPSDIELGVLLCPCEMGGGITLKPDVSKYPKVQLTLE